MCMSCVPGWFLSNGSLFDDFFQNIWVSRCQIMLSTRTLFPVRKKATFCLQILGPGGTLLGDRCVVHGPTRKISAVGRLPKMKRREVLRKSFHWKRNILGGVEAKKKV